MCLQVMRWVGSAWVSWKMADAGPVEAVHRAVIGRRSACPAGPRGGCPQPRAGLPVVTRSAPVPRTLPCDLGIPGGRVAVQHRQGGTLGEVHALSIESTCRVMHGVGGAVRVVQGAEPPPPQGPRPHHCTAAEAAVEAVRADVGGRVGTAVRGTGPARPAALTALLQGASGAARTAAAAVGARARST